MLSKLFRWLQGRHTGFAIYFTLMGTTLSWFHKLDINFIMLIGAIQSFVLAHSAKEDYFENLKKKVNNDTGATDNTASITGTNLLGS